MHPKITRTPIDIPISIQICSVDRESSIDLALSVFVFTMGFDDLLEFEELVLEV